MPYIGKEPADIIATAVDTTTGTFSGAVSAASLDADGGVTVDNITIDGTEIDLSSGNLTLDVAGQLVINSDSGQVVLQDDTVNWGNLQNSSGDFIIGSLGTDKDIKIQGLDGSSTIDALTFDMSNAGQANFNSSIFTGNTAEFVDGTGTGDIGIQLNPIGLTISTRNGGISGIFGRQASDGDILQFRKDGSAVGTLGANGGRPYIAGPSKGIKFGNGSANPVTNTGAASDNGYDLGSTNVRWKDIYLAGGLFVGGTGSANELDDYEEGTWTPVITVESQSAASITVDVAEYTKVGRLVSIVFQVTIDSISGGTDARAIELTGMPFNINSNAGGGPNIGYSTINSMTGTLSLQGRSSTLYRIVNLNGTTSLNASDHLKANSILRGQFTYHST